MTTIKTIAAGISGLALLVAAPAFALTVSTGVVGDVQVGSTSSDVNVSTQVSGGASSQNATSMDEGSNSSTNASDSESMSSSVSADLSVPLVVTRADVDNATIQASGISAGNVQTKEDLSGYIAARMQSDANLSAVDTASDHVAVTYPEHAELFGFIPVTVETTAATDASGNVSITQPWWAFLAASNQSALQASVQASVQSTLGGSAQANAQLTASEQAQLVAAIQNAMAAAASADASADMSASTNVNVQ